MGRRKLSEQEKGRAYREITRFGVLGMQPRIQGQACDQPHLQSPELSQTATTASDVQRGNQPPKQASRRREGNFPLGLCVSRDEQETLILHTSDGDIIIGVSEVCIRKVKLVIQAPKSVVIVRDELLQRK